MRKKATTVTLSIRTTLPKGSNVATLLETVRKLMSENFENEEVAVNLIKKETLYA